MPTLNWIGREAVINHHNNVPYRLLRPDEQLSAGDPDSGNLLIEGDNLEALKALLPYYGGQVKCIYIDPPYNTGATTWVYNDNVQSPVIRDWLGKVVGREAEDLTRHDKWLCMMYPRMRLLADFLRPDGFLLVSLDETELANFRLMMETILPAKSFICALNWKSRRNLDNRSLHNVSIDHEYVAAFRTGTAAFRGTAIDMSKYSNPDDDPRGPWMSDNLVGLATRERRPNLHYDLVNPDTGDVYPCPPKGWRYSPDTMAELIAQGEIIWPRLKGGRPRHKHFAAKLTREFAGFSSFVDSGNTNEGTEEVSRIMGGELFIFPKPRSLIQSLLRQTTSGSDIILDSFAGTGTTAHAVLALNAEDAGSRRYILVEMEPGIARDITAERLRRVGNGYAWTDSRGTNHIVNGLGGGFRFCSLGETLFDEHGAISPQVTFADLSAHVFFTETHQPLPETATLESPLIGAFRGTTYYLFFNGVRGGSSLDAHTLTMIQPSDAPVVVYADTCTLSPRLLSERGIAFKQIPYEVTRG